VTSAGSLLTLNAARQQKYNKKEKAKLQFEFLDAFITKKQIMEKKMIVQ
jgi:hypothetical protein